MAYEIKRDPNTGLFIVVDTDTGKYIGRAELPTDAINLAISKGMPADNKDALVAEARAVIDAENAKFNETPAEGTPTTGVTAATPLTQTPPPSSDKGTDPPVKTLSQTQATSPATPLGVDNGADPYVSNGQSTIPYAPYDDGSDPYVSNGQSTIATSENAAPAVAPTDPGVGASDDGYTEAIDAEINKKNSKTVTGVLNNNTKEMITPRPNVLDSFGSYTYQASVYLMSPTEYTSLIRSKKKVINGYNLLFQSGGAPNNVGGFQGALNANNQAIAADAAAGGFGAGVTGTKIPGASDTSAGRNPAFPYDFYIDSITIKNALQGKGTGVAHNVTDLKFTVVEPGNITLIDRIYEAVQDHGPKEESGKINYSSAQYLMVIRWYGYDETGRLVPGITGADASTGMTDPNAVIEKFIPFKINTINWSVSSRLVTYDFNCSPIGQTVAGGTRRGTVPYDMQLSDGSVGGVLGGPPVVATDANRGAPTNTTTRATQASVRALDNAIEATGAPPKASSAPTPKKVIKSGLAGAMTEFNKTLTEGDLPVYETADEYEIVFAKGAEAIRDATLVLPGVKKESNQTPMAPPPTKDSKSAGDKADSKDTTVKNISIVAGQPIVQVIDTIIRNSSYINNQALVTIDAESGQETVTDVKTKNVNWYRINFEATPKMPYDFKRNDYAYKVKFIISPYAIDKFDSKYFPLGHFRGVHKSYKWIFTGQNTQILDYSETLNTAYTQLVSGSAPGDSAAEKTRRAMIQTMRDWYTYTYGPRSGENSQGSRTRGNEVSANLADSLYTSGDLATVKLRIIGDPAWIQQGSLAGGVSAADFNTSSFLPDGTINFDAEQILFEVQWKRPDDYNLGTGLANPNAVKQSDSVSRLYQANEVLSEFKQGKFEQTITGGLWQMPKPDGSNKAPKAPMPTKKPEPEKPANPKVVPGWAKPTSVTGQTPTSQTAIGVQQLLRPTTNGSNLTDNQLRATPIYIQARKNGERDAAALDAARAASAAGTNNYSGSALPGIRDTTNTAVPGSGANGTTPIVKDGNPG